MDRIPQKCCSKCNKLFPATPEYFSRAKIQKDGLRPACKICMKAQQKNYQSTHKEDRKRYYQEHKEEINEKSRQYNQSHREAILKQRREHYQANRRQMIEIRRKYYREHRADILAQSKQYNGSRREHRRNYNQAYRATHSEELQVRDRRYNKTEHGRMVRSAGNHRHRARKLSAPGNLTPEQIQYKLRLQKYRCYYCDKKFEQEDGRYMYQLEHIVPVSRTESYPRHDVNYVVLSCKPCNLKKHNKLPHEFFEGGRLL